MGSGADGGSGGAAPSGAQRRRNAPAAPVAALEACHQLLLWLIPALETLPRRQKFLLGDRIQTQAQDVMDALIEATYTRDREPALRRASLGLQRLRFGLRLALDLKLMPFAKYEHAGRLIDALGRQVGGWLRAHRPSAGPAQTAAPVSDGPAG